MIHPLTTDIKGVLKKLKNILWVKLLLCMAIFRALLSPTYKFFHTFILLLISLVTHFEMMILR